MVLICRELPLLGDPRVTGDKGKVSRRDVAQVFTAANEDFSYSMKTGDIFPWSEMVSVAPNGWEE